MSFNTESLLSTGIQHFSTIPTSEIPFGEEIRKICETGCRNYNTTWACPPAVGSLAACMKTCQSFEKAMVFNAVYPLEDSFDWEGMQQGHRAFKDTCDQLYALVRPMLDRFLLLSNEGCLRCKTCTWSQSPCRFPEKLFPSLEGYGVYVNQLAERAGLKYINGANTVTYFGMLLY